MGIRSDLRSLAGGVAHYWTERCTFDYEACVLQCEEPDASRPMQAVYFAMHKTHAWWAIERAGRVWRVLTDYQTGVLQRGVSLTRASGLVYDRIMCADVLSTLTEGQREELALKVCESLYVSREEYDRLNIPVDDGSTIYVGELPQPQDETTIHRVRDWLEANKFHLGETLDETLGFNQAVNQVRNILDDAG